MPRACPTPVPVCASLGKAHKLDEELQMWKENYQQQVEAMAAVQGAAETDGNHLAEARHKLEEAEAEVLRLRDRVDVTEQLDGE